MSPKENKNDDDGFFNDLSRQPDSGAKSSISPVEPCMTAGEVTPKMKRIACVICRKRKLKCDGKRPKCATCDRLGHNCAYDEVRRKSGPKRGYVKDLEARLAQVESQLTAKAKKSKLNDEVSLQKEVLSHEIATAQSQQGSKIPDMPMHVDSVTTIPPPSDPLALSGADMAPSLLSDSQMVPGIDLNLDDSFSWEMISLGLEEPMPTQEAIDELTNIYFETAHLSLPMIHKVRYLAAMDLPVERRPPVCLRYIIWCHAAATTDKYIHHQDIFYRRARKYIELDEMKGQGEAFVSLAHAQAWTLIATYEFKMMYFPRAWMSVGRASRLALMMGLSRVDGVELDVKQCLPPPRDWTEREERRRTFWMAYCVDRYASIGTGWPMSIDERDIMTVLPASEEAYERNMPQQTQNLSDALTPKEAMSLSPFAGVVFVTHFFGLNLTHLHRPEPGQAEDDLEGKFWTRHRQLDNSLSQTTLLLPDHLRLPAGFRNPNTVFLNFSLHTSIICLHQAAIFKAEKNGLSSRLVQDSRDRCIAAACRIAEIMRLSSDMDAAAMNPFLAFCLYVAARVFIQYLKKTPQNVEIRASLDLLLTAMRVLQRKNPLAESFLVQLNLDIEGSRLDLFIHNPDRTTQAKDDANGVLNHMDEFIASGGGKRSFHSTAIHFSEDSQVQSADNRGLPSWEPSQVWNGSNGSTFARLESSHKTQFALRQNGPSPACTLAAPDNGNPAFFPDIGGSNASDGMLFQNKWNNGDGSEISDQGVINNSSNGLTPGSSTSYNHSSSNSVLTPPEMTDEPGNVPPNNIQPTMGDRAHPSNGLTSADSMLLCSQLPDQSSGRPQGNGDVNLGGKNFFANNTNLPLVVNLQENDPFKLASGWDPSLNPVMTPGPLAGMTPEGGWANWESGG